MSSVVRRAMPGDGASENIARTRARVISCVISLGTSNSCPSRQAPATAAVSLVITVA